MRNEDRREGRGHAANYALFRGVTGPDLLPVVEVALLLLGREFGHELRTAQNRFVQEDRVIGENFVIQQRNCVAVG